MSIFGGSPIRVALAVAAILLIILVHVGAIGVIMTNVGLLAAAAVAALLLIAHLIAKPLSFHWRHQIGRKAVSHGSAALLIAGALLVTFGFVLAHLCNARIDVLQLCLHPRPADLVCHKIGPVLLVVGLVGILAVRRVPVSPAGVSGPSGED
jgi:hypothetical protein